MLGGSSRELERVLYNALSDHDGSIVNEARKSEFLRHLHDAQGLMWVGRGRPSARVAAQYETS
jgi:hypothetical protein